MFPRCTQESPADIICFFISLHGADRMNRVLLIAAVSAIAASIPLSGQDGGGLDANVLKGLELRSLGPALATGRIQDVDIDPKNPSVWYVASAFGGLWKTTNRG